MPEELDTLLSKYYTLLDLADLENLRLVEPLFACVAQVAGGKPLFPFLSVQGKNKK